MYEYEDHEVKDFRVGDKVVYPDWGRVEILKGRYIEILERDHVRGRIRYRFDSDRTTAGMWVSEHGLSGNWQRIVDHKPYDPSQQGDKDDDI
jgi:hypothetical protein